MKKLYNLFAGMNVGIRSITRVGCFYVLSILSACKVPDTKKIIGKWQSDRDWFVFAADMTYSSGKDDIQMVHGFHYTLDPEKHELNLYTKDPQSTYYLYYEWNGEDTLQVRNVLSTNKDMVDFIRIKTSMN
jgi:hypothetical protein